MLKRCTFEVIDELTISHILIMAKLEDLPFLMTWDKFLRSQII